MGKIKQLEEEIILLKLQAKKCCDKNTESAALVDASINDKIITLLGEALSNQTKSATNETSSLVTRQYLETYLNENLAAIKEEVLHQAKQSSELALRDGIRN